MGKYLTNFKTKEEYDAFKSSSDYVVPNVSFVEDSGSIINDSYQISGGGNSDDVIFYDAGKISMNLNDFFLEFLYPSFLNQNTLFIEENGLKYAMSDTQGIMYYNRQNVKCVAVSAYINARFLHAGSGFAYFEDLPNSLHIYDYCSLLQEFMKNEQGMEFDLFYMLFDGDENSSGIEKAKAAEITKEQVLQWLNAQ